MSLSPEILAETHAAAFVHQRPWTALEFKSLLQGPGSILCGDARSFLVARVIGPEAELLTVATHPDFRGEGRADSCVLQFLSVAAAQGAKQAFLEVADDNVPAIRLYQKHKFSQVGRRARYYPRPNGAKIDAIVMQKQL